jgi:hypothetical protein
MTLPRRDAIAGHATRAQLAVLPRRASLAFHLGLAVRAARPGLRLGRHHEAQRALSQALDCSPRCTSSEWRRPRPRVQPHGMRGSDQAPGRMQRPKRRRDAGLPSRGGVHRRGHSSLCRCINSSGELRRSFRHQLVSRSGNSQNRGKLVQRKLPWRWIAEHHCVGYPQQLLRRHVQQCIRVADATVAVTHWHHSQA